MPRRSSLRIELLAVLALVLMMAVVSLSLAGLWLARDRDAASMERQLEAHTEGLAALVAAAPGGFGSVDRLEPILRPSLGILGIESIIVYRREHAGSTIVLEVGLPTSTPPPAFDDFRNRERIADRVVIDRAIRTFTPSTRPLLVLRVVADPDEPLTQREWPPILLRATGVGLVALVLGAALLETQVLRPLHRLRDAVDAVAGGVLTAPMPEDGPRELAVVAAAFNQMTASLRARIAEIETQRVQLVHAEQLASLGRIAAGIAHEVGNPLAASMGYIELLLAPPHSPDADHLDILRRCRVQLERIERLIGQLLDYGRPSRSPGLPVPACTEVSLDEAVQRVAHLLRHDPRGHGAHVETVGVTARKVWVDAAWLDQVLHNLLLNAARAQHGAASAETRQTPSLDLPGSDRPAIRVTVGDSGTDVWLEIQDAGPGVPPEIRAHLFEPFVTTAPAGEGTGLGLAICRALISAMGGHIECLPAGARPPLPGQSAPGAVFRVELPAAPEGTAGAVPAE